MVPILTGESCDGWVSIGAFDHRIAIAGRDASFLCSALTALGLAATLVADHLARADARRVVPEPPYPLTERQREVLALFVTGLRVSTIAERLYVSPDTVRNHLKAIFRSYGVRNQAELVALFGQAKRSLN